MKRMSCDWTSKVNAKHTLSLVFCIKIIYCFQPFEASSKPSRRFIFFLILSSWIFSFFLALLPFSTTLEFIFKDEAIVKEYYFFRKFFVRLDSAKNWTENLLTYDPVFKSSLIDTAERIRDAASWHELQSLVANSSVAFALEADQYFG